MSSAQLIEIEININNDRVLKVHTVHEFDEALRLAENKLVVLEYATSHNYYNKRIYLFMADLSRIFLEVRFILVTGDESMKTNKLRARNKKERKNNITYVPLLSFIRKW